MNFTELKEAADLVVSHRAKMGEVCYGDDGEDMAADIMALFAYVERLEAAATGIVNALSSREARELMHRDASFSDHYKTLRMLIALE